jgi:mannose/cellobiose epimerase-like protein (N-acyl-D-glucosamine 2-epimerase family)
MSSGSRVLTSSRLATTSREAGCCARRRRFLATPRCWKRVRSTAVKMAQAVYEQGLTRMAGCSTSASPTAIIDTDKHWWPQAEAVVGFLNAYELSGRRHFMDAAERSWAFIEKHIVDREHGEWFWLVRKAGVPDARSGQGGPMEVSLPQQPHLL